MSGPRRYSRDLPQGGLELPCIYRFSGPNDLTQKAQKVLEGEGNAVSKFTNLQSKHTAIATILHGLFPHFCSNLLANVSL